MDKLLADEISNRLLDEFSRSLLAEQCDLFCSCHHLPNLIEVSKSVRLVANRREMERTHAALRGYLLRNDIKDVVSTITAVEPLTTERLGVTVVISFVTAEGRSVAHPFPVFWLLDRKKNSWGISCSIIAILNAPDLIAAFEGRDPK